jgi:hypothetical protein
MLAQAICAFPHSRPDISYEEQALVLLLVPGSGWASQQREDEDLQRGVGEKQPAGRKMKDERTVVRRKMIIGHERLPLPNWTAYGVRRHSARFASCELLLHGSRFEVVQTCAAYQKCALNLHDRARAAGDTVGAGASARSYAETPDAGWPALADQNSLAWRSDTLSVRNRSGSACKS